MTHAGTTAPAHPPSPASPRHPPRLTAQEEGDLARTIEAGVFARHLLETRTSCPFATPGDLRAVVERGEQARERFLAANLGLVIHVVRRDAGGSAQDRDDLIQEGCLGLAEALAGFDWARGTRFSTWAVPYVRGRIAEARRLDRGGIRIPVRRLRAAAAAGEQVVTTASIHGVEELEATWWRDDTAVGDDEPGAVELADGWRELTRRERAVLTHRFGLAGRQARTQTATAAALGIPVKTVRLVEAAALERLREVCLAGR
ncbi:sigma-70 family RNA polymerase sigma factor [Raineyella sp. LH-20]|uniref:sigma-70 family RNA polymerase sigma factor n=1 Tax=Raineyella sp. LH-20 TaxID=3081204 RepID=UPI002953E6AD|nr:sigma-70 family RNA polymerase sigma factor [Raineyella sp. LH-20]WOP17822.1 sigma-70 family RNA polymerase sigma factor [Raineyella sp. LH-20]